MKVPERETTSLFMSKMQYEALVQQSKCLTQNSQQEAAKSKWKYGCDLALGNGVKVGWVVQYNPPEYSGGAPVHVARYPTIPGANGRTSASALQVTPISPPNWTSGELNSES